MKILMLHTVSLGVAHYRFWGPARALEAAGHDVTYFPDKDGRGDSLMGINELHGDPFKWLLKHAQDYDVIHWGYSTWIHHIEMAVALRNASKVPFMTDFDDDIYNVPSYNMAFKEYHPGAPERRVVRLGAKVADALSLSTEALLGEFVHKADNPTLFHLPNLYDPSVWEGLEVDPQRQRDESVRVLFSGGLGRFGDLSLEAVKEAVEVTMAKFDGTGGKPMVRLFFLGCAPDWAGKWMQDKLTASANRSFMLRFCPLSTYFQMLKWLSPDIVINPVEANVFNRSKSAIKGLEAGVVGAAFMCTDWDTHATIPVDACVKVSNTRAQWVEGLEQLVTDATFRRKTAVKLTKWVDSQRYSDHIHLWESAYKAVIEKGPMDDAAMYATLHRAPKGVINASSGRSVERNNPVNAG